MVFFLLGEIVLALAEARQKLNCNNDNQIITNNNGILFLFIEFHRSSQIVYSIMTVFIRSSANKNN